MTIAESLKRFRAEFHLSQKDVAEKMGKQQAGYYRYESGEYIPRADDIAKLATAYNVTADYLLGLTDEPQPKSQEVRDKELWEQVMAHNRLFQIALNKAAVNYGYRING